MVKAEAVCPTCHGRIVILRELGSTDDSIEMAGSHLPDCTVMTRQAQRSDGKRREEWERLR
jgi:hypothetical protein